MALVIERRRHLLDGTVTERDFEAEPETCDLTAEDLHRNIGRATQLVEAPAELSVAYNRAQRLTAARALVLGLMPLVGDVHSALRRQDFGNAEIADLWPDLVPAVAEDFTVRCGQPVERRASRQAGEVFGVPEAPGLPDWARDQLARNAE
ncbi:MAG: hypothetical protein BGO82_17045 [Devosia sp. 67-54]|nr:MAG: hypothetical protein BGO82_17045 [Devosia sp. 67-54]